MRTFATLVLYERHGQPALGYRAETIGQIAHGDMAEGTHGSWELRCWTLTGAPPRYGVTGDELSALMGATFRAIEHCLGADNPSETIRRFHCVRGGPVIEIPSSQSLSEHLVDWSNQAALNDVFLQARQVGIAQLQAIGQQLQLEIEAMMNVKDKLIGRSATKRSCEP